ncbi:MAG: 2Fe-2S iron-sulfur cluster binding domain-containing protein [Cyanobacteriota bacterium]|nr:2Fe-2S iron-sulfur cluster binding domain-containing protein [Cyanobacteriota bacterium]
MSQTQDSITIQWPHGGRTTAQPGRDWLAVAREARWPIPTGCLGGSCGACEIDVNGQVVRACIAKVPASRSRLLQVAVACDPHW